MMRILTLRYVMTYSVNDRQTDITSVVLYADVINAVGLQALAHITSITSHTVERLSHRFL